MEEVKQVGHSRRALPSWLDLKANFRSRELVSLWTLSVRHVTSSWMWGSVRRMKKCLLLPVPNRKVSCRAFWYQSSQHWSYCLRWITSPRGRQQYCDPAMCVCGRKPEYQEGTHTDTERNYANSTLCCPGFWQWFWSWVFIWRATELTQIRLRMPN